MKLIDELHEHFLKLREAGGPVKIAEEAKEGMHYELHELQKPMLRAGKAGRLSVVTNSMMFWTVRESLFTTHSRLTNSGLGHCSSDEGARTALPGKTAYLYCKNYEMIPLTATKSLAAERRSRS